MGVCDVCHLHTSIDDPKINATAIWEKGGGGG